jgi:hypothetical protein
MASASGLGFDDRIRCRDLVVAAAKLARAHEAGVHYSMLASQRWDGIRNRRDARDGEFPTHADCSSFATWCLWNGLSLGFGRPDTVNGEGWNAGFTGTMLTHGMRVRAGDSIMRGDCVFYDNPRHVTIVVSRVNGVHMVISHGTEGGPDLRRWNYRQPMQIRRYI